MELLCPTLAGLTFLLLPVICTAQQPTGGRPPDADGIMAIVAANQERSEAGRERYVYVQHAHVVSRKGSTVMCEEITDSRVTPSPSGSHTELLRLDGRVRLKGKYTSYNTPLPNQSLKQAGGEHAIDSVTVNLGGDNGDRDLVGGLRAGLTEDQSKDGIDPRLFPLTSVRQKNYAFKLLGREHRNDRDVFHIEFRPRDKSDFDWKGDAYIDTATYQPVLISTAMARKIPFAVRTLLGTNLPGLGFTIVYAPQADGLWFPVSLGTEFKLHVLFFYSREIIIDAQNHGFQKTHAEANMLPLAESR